MFHVFLANNLLLLPLNVGRHNFVFSANYRYFPALSRRFLQSLVEEINTCAISNKNFTSYYYFSICQTYSPREVEIYSLHRRDLHPDLHSKSLSPEKTWKKVSCSARVHSRVPGRGHSTHCLTLFCFVSIKDGRREHRFCHRWIRSLHQILVPSRWSVLQDGPAPRVGENYKS